jgi:hypothetical protein
MIDIDGAHRSDPPAVLADFGKRTDPTSRCRVRGATSPLVNGRYRIFVRAYNSLGSSGWSNPFDFEVTA